MGVLKTFTLPPVPFATATGTCERVFLIESSYNEVNNNSLYYYFWDCKNNYMFQYNGKVIIEIKSNPQKIWKISTIKYGTCKIIEPIISSDLSDSSENNILVI